MSSTEPITTKPLRVGIIGATAERGWAKESHVPAVQKLAGLELTAVATGINVDGWLHYPAGRG